MKYVLGIIGGLLFGFLAGLPWLLVYLYGNMMLSLLAIPIAIGVNFGYRLLKGKVNKSLPIIISILSLIVVIVICLVFIPLGLLNKEGYDVSLENLDILYNNKDFMGALIKDLFISIIFTFLGISGVVSKIKKEVNLDIEDFNINKDSTKTTNNEEE